MGDDKLYFKAIARWLAEFYPPSCPCTSETWRRDNMEMAIGRPPVVMRSIRYTDANEPEIGIHRIFSSSISAAVSMGTRRKVYVPFIVYLSTVDDKGSRRNCPRNHLVGLDPDRVSMDPCRGGGVFINLPCLSPFHPPRCFHFSQSHTSWN